MSGLLICGRPFPIIAHLFPLGAFSSCTLLIWQFTQSARECATTYVGARLLVLLKQRDFSMPHFRFENISLVTALHRHSTQRERPTARPTHAAGRSFFQSFPQARGAKKQNRAARYTKTHTKKASKKHTDATGVCASLFISCSSSLEFLSPRNATEPNKSHRENAP
jgi:hypothetical protein